MFSLAKRVMKPFRAIADRVNHRWLYGGLILGFIMKSVGAAWDVSYHFKHFRDFYQLPHLLNASGDALILILLIYLWKKEPKRDRPQLKIIMYGILVFLAAIGFDQWYHDVFGIDLTTWSPSHFMLYAGSFIALIGAFLYMLNDFRHSRISQRAKTWLSLIFGYLIFDTLVFPLLQQEQFISTPAT